MKANICWYSGIVFTLSAFTSKKILTQLQVAKDKMAEAKQAMEKVCCSRTRKVKQ